LKDEKRNARLRRESLRTFSYENTV